MSKAVISSDAFASTQMKNTTLFMPRFFKTNTLLFIYSINSYFLIIKVECFLMFTLVERIIFFSNPPIHSERRHRSVFKMDFRWLHWPKNNNKKGTIQFTCWLNVFRFLKSAYPNICLSSTILFRRFLHRPAYWITLI